VEIKQPPYGGNLVKDVLDRSAIVRGEVHGNLLAVAVVACLLLARAAEAEWSKWSERARKPLELKCFETKRCPVACRLEHHFGTIRVQSHTVFCFYFTSEASFSPCIG
jgi:hypothetical protein